MEEKMWEEEELLARFEGLDTSLVSDALEELGIPGGLLGIWPVVPGQRLLGRAYTVRYVPCGLEKPSVGTYIAEVEKGLVVVIDNAGRCDYAIWGDLMTRMAKIRGVEGVVIDGACRDIEAIRETGFPVYARGKSMVSGRHHVQVEQTQIPISVAGMRVCPGDLIFGDETGVIAIPYAKVMQVAKKAQEISEKEKAWIRALL